MEYKYKKNKMRINIDFDKDILIDEEEFLYLLNIYILNNDITDFVSNIINLLVNNNVNEINIFIKNKTDHYYFVYNKNSLLKYTYIKEFPDSMFKIKYNNTFKKIDYGLKSKQKNNVSHDCSDILSNNFIIINSLKQVDACNEKIQKKKTL